jgi:hypothetical protein
MFGSPTWDAIPQQCPWFAAAGAVLVVAIGLLIAIKPTSSRRAEITDAAVDNMGWILTRRIDFSDSNAIGKLMLEAEETRSVIGSTGVEHREIRWRRATLDEAKTVLESYNAHENLATSATFAVSSSAGTKPSDAELKEAGKGQDMADVTLVPQDIPVASDG